MSLAPFDITLDVGDLAGRLRSGEIVLIPFAAEDATTIERAWDALADMIGAVPLGAFGVVALTRRDGRTAGSAVALGASLVVLVETAQVFVRSHAAQGTDAAFATLGVALGVWVTRRLLPGRQRRSGEVSGISRLAVAGVLAAAAVAVFYHWQPFASPSTSRAFARSSAEFRYYRSPATARART